MRRVIGYDGRTPIWSENQPAEPLAPRVVRGSLVSGHHISERERQRQYQRDHVARVAARAAEQAEA